MKPFHACYHLCHKTYFYPAPADPAEMRLELHAPPRERGTPFWCLKTHDALGPDGAHCGETLCDGARSCFEPEVQV